MKTLFFAIGGFFYGIVFGWLLAFVSHISVELAILWIEISSVTACIAGVALGMRWKKRGSIRSAIDFSILKWLASITIGLALIVVFRLLYEA